jgi:hypothetical protein
MTDKLQLADDIVAFTNLLLTVLASGDADSVIDGMHKVTLEIAHRARELRQALDDEPGADAT